MNKFSFLNTYYHFTRLFIFSPNPIHFMHFSLKVRSFFLFMLVYSSFFSCQQIIEIIQPTHPKPVQDTCQVTKISQVENGSFTQYTYDSKGQLIKEAFSAGTFIEYTYDANGRVVKETGSLGGFTDYTYDQMGRLIKRVHDSNNGDPDSFRITTETYTYNEQNKLIEYTLSAYRAGTYTTYKYDTQGRISKVATEYDHYFEYDPTTEYSYNGNTITVKTRATHDFEDTKTSQTTYVFENGNLIKMRMDKSLDGDSDGYEITYTYTTDTNKLVIPRVVDPTDVTADMLKSKNLISKTADSDGKVTTYEWELNKQGYPVKSTVTSPTSTSQTIYEYSCDK